MRDSDAIVLREIEPDRLWVAEHGLRVAGMELGRRMTIVRLPDGGLWLHSPSRPGAELRARLGPIGPVRFLVAPNRFHHRWLDTWQAAYPAAELIGAPGLADKRDDLEFDGTLGRTADPRWTDAIEQHLVGGAPRLSEVVFHHRATRTLVVTDLCFHLRPASLSWTGLVTRALGTYRRLATSRLVRLAIEDRDAFRDSIERILAWDVERLVMGHGEIVQDGAGERLRRAFEWLLGPTHPASG